jgi:hypothetical protein
MSTPGPVQTQSPALREFYEQIETAFVAHDARVEQARAAELNRQADLRKQRGESPPGMIRHALRYAEIGWPVFPLHTPVNGSCSCGRSACKSIGKHPRTRHGAKDATIATSQIKAWWSKWPDANIGVATGPLTGTVLDVDPRNGGDASLEKLKALYGEEWMQTPTASTGSGGLHIFLRHDADVRGGKLDGLPGIDVKDEGGYVVAAASLHASGRRYEWRIKPTQPMLPQPEWLRELRQPVMPKPAATVAPDDIDTRHPLTERIRRATADMRTWEPCPAEGQGSDTTVMQRAARLVVDFALPEGVALDLLVNWVRRSQPDFDEDWIETKVRNATRYGTNERGCALERERPVQTNPAPVVREMPPPTRPTRRFPIYSLNQLRQIPPPESLIDGMLDRGLVFLAGEPGVGKSFAALSKAVAIASGQRWLGLQTDPGPVVYLTAEGQSAFAIRADAAIRAAGLDPSASIPLFAITETLPFNNGSDVQALASQIREEVGDIKLVIVDTLQRYSEGNENQQEHMAAFVHGCDVLRAALGAGMLVVHHTTKDGVSIRGSSVIRGSADQVVMIEEDSGVLTLTTDSSVHKDAKQKDGPPKTQRVKLRVVAALDECGKARHDKFGMPITTCVVERAEGVTAKGRGAETDIEVLRTLASFRREATQKQIVERSGKPKSTVASCLSRLVAKEWADNGRSGYYTATDAGRTALATEARWSQMVGPEPDDDDDPGRVSSSARRPSDSEPDDDESHPRRPRRPDGEKASACSTLRADDESKRSSSSSSKTIPTDDDGLGLKGRPVVRGGVSSCSAAGDGPPPEPAPGCLAGDPVALPVGRTTGPANDRKVKLPEGMEVLEADKYGPVVLRKSPSCGPKGPAARRPLPTPAGYVEVPV